MPESSSSRAPGAFNAVDLSTPNRSASPEASSKPNNVFPHRFVTSVRRKIQSSQKTTSSKIQSSHIEHPSTSPAQLDHSPSSSIQPEPVQDGPNTVQERQALRPQPSAELSPNGSSKAPSRLSQVSMSQPDVPTLHPLPAIDTSKIVRMALNLSESRRIRAHSAQLAVPPNTPDRRSLTNSHVAPLSTPTSTSFSLRSSQDRSVEAQDPFIANLPLGYPLDLSSATISRANKAKSYIELSCEYWRLLDSLPPLHPVNTADVSFPGMGRSYNPLQYIRNRRVRLRERDTFDANASGWNDINLVTPWIDSVAGRSRHSGYYTRDYASLPSLGTHAQLSTDGAASSRLSSLPRVSATAKEMMGEWTVRPADLLADAYWLEQDSHKALIESRSGKRLFAAHQRPETKHSTTSHFRSSSDFRFHRHRRESASQRSPDVQSTSISPISARSTSDAAYDSVNSRVKPESARFGRNTFRRPLHNSGNVSELSLSDAEDTAHTYLDTQNPDAAGTGPLEKHMNAMLKHEAHNYHKNIPVEQDQSHQANGRRAGLSEASATFDGNSNRPYTPFDDQTLINSNMPKTTSSPRHSTDLLNLSRSNTGNREDVLASHAIEKHPKQRNTAAKEKPGRLGFLHVHPFRNKRTSEDHLDISDEDNAIKNISSVIHPNVSARSSRVDTNRHESQDDRAIGSDSAPDSPPGIHDKHHSQNHLSEDASNSTNHFFKRGRIGEIVRREKPQQSNVGRKRRESQHGSFSSSVGPDSSSDAEGIASFHQRRHSKEDQSPASRRRPQRSASADNHSRLQPPAFHVKNLPSFISSNAQGRRDTQEDVSPYQHHVYLQQERRKLDHELSRFNSLAPPSLDTTSDISPTTSSPDLTRRDNHPKNGYFVAPGITEPQTHVGVQSADKRLNAVLSRVIKRDDRPGATKDPKPGREHAGYRDWTIADKAPTFDLKQGTVTSRDIAYLRSVLLTSGSKAKSIVRHAEEPIHSSEGVRTTDMPSNLDFILHQNEYVESGRAFSERIDTAISKFDTSARQVRDQNFVRLQTQINDLQEQATSKLLPQVRSCGDEADAFIARMTTTHTLAVTQVLDSVDTMMRRRRKRLRFLRRASFLFLEWLLVSILWFIWLFVSSIRLIKICVLAVVRSVRWLLWI